MYPVGVAYLKHAVVDESESSFNEDDVEYVDDVAHVVDDPPVDAVLRCLITREVRHHAVRYNGTVVV